MPHPSYPLMIFAPGWLRSELSFWRHSPSNPSAPAVWMNPMAELAPNVEVLRQWKGPEHLQAAIDGVTRFRGLHTPH